MDDSSVVLYKKLTTRAVRQAAEALMRQKDFTTTLDVKTLLRSQLYMAFQHEVSQKMNSIATQQGWVHTFNGAHKEYRFAPVTPTLLDDDGLSDDDDGDGLSDD